MFAVGRDRRLLGDRGVPPVGGTVPAGSDHERLQLVAVEHLAKLVAAPLRGLLGNPDPRGPPCDFDELVGVAGIIGRSPRDPELPGTRAGVGLLQNQPSAEDALAVPTDDHEEVVAGLVEKERVDAADLFGHTPRTWTRYFSGSSPTSSGRWRTVGTPLSPCRRAERSRSDTGLDSDHGACGSVLPDKRPGEGSLTPPAPRSLPGRPGGARDWS